MKEHSQSAVRTFISASIIAIVILLAFKYSPVLFQKKVSEKAPSASSSAEQTKTIASGSFAGLATFKAQGDASIIRTGDKYILRFGDNFKSEIGPDTHIFFGKDGVRDAASEVAVLKGSEGGQNYEIPSRIDLNGVNEVWIHCNQVSVDFSKASLKFASAK